MEVPLEQSATLLPRGWAGAPESEARWAEVEAEWLDIVT